MRYRQPWLFVGGGLAVCYGRYIKLWYFITSSLRNQPWWTTEFWSNSFCSAKNFLLSSNTLSLGQEINLSPSTLSPRKMKLRCNCPVGTRELVLKTCTGGQTVLFNLDWTDWGRELDRGSQTCWAAATHQPCLLTILVSCLPAMKSKDTCISEGKLWQT